MANPGLVSLIKKVAHPIKAKQPHKANFEKLLKSVGEAQVVLLGAPSLGSKETFQHRAEFTKMLIEEKNFSGVMIGADWPVVYPINKYVQGEGEAVATPFDVLNNFKHYPRFAWRNTSFLDFISWLKIHNDNLKFHGKPGMVKAGLWGMDLYSVHASTVEVSNFLKQFDPKAARQARKRYSTMYHHTGSPAEIASQIGIVDKRAHAQLNKQLIVLQKERQKMIKKGMIITEAGYFNADMNAKLLVDADQFYKTVFQEGFPASWNLREKHMADVLEGLSDYISIRLNRPAKIVVWQNNTHLGDSNSTDRGVKGEVNFGRLIRERYGMEKTFNIGFTTHHGRVLASPSWGVSPSVTDLLPADPKSNEGIFHESGVAAFFMNFRSLSADVKVESEVVEAFRESRPQRTLGVIYNKGNEKENHYYNARLSEQFDAVVHVDQTRATHALDVHEPEDASLTEDVAKSFE